MLHKYPYEMSGGQQQRVAAARVIITKPALILADEPTGALDSKSARILLTQLSQLNEIEQATILMVTHDSVSASYCKRNVICVSKVKLLDLLLAERKNELIVSQ